MKPHFKVDFKLVLVVLLVVGIVAAVNGALSSWRAEKALHACILTTRLVELYVKTTRGNWPTSWDDLQSRVPSAESDGIFQWPNDRPDMERFVEIDFHADPRKLSRKSPEEFDAIKPIGDCYSSYGRHFSFVIEELRKHHMQPAE